MRLTLLLVLPGLFVLSTVAAGHENQDPADLRPGAHSKEDFDAHREGRECPGRGHDDQDLHGNPVGHDSSPARGGGDDHGGLGKELLDTAVQRAKDCAKGAALGLGGSIPAGIGAKVASKEFTGRGVAGMAVAGCVGNALKEGYQEYKNLGGNDALKSAVKDSFTNANGKPNDCALPPASSPLIEKKRSHLEW